MTTPLARRGEIFPAFTLPGLDGSPVALEDLRARANLVLVFAADEVGGSAVTGLLEQLRTRRRERFVLSARPFGWLARRILRGLNATSSYPGDSV